MLYSTRYGCNIRKRWQPPQQAPLALRSLSTRKHMDGSDVGEALAGKINFFHGTDRTRPGRLTFLAPDSLQIRNPSGTCTPLMLDIVACSPTDSFGATMDGGAFFFLSLVQKSELHEKQASRRLSCAPNPSARTPRGTSLIPHGKTALLQFSSHLGTATSSVSGDSFKSTNISSRLT